MPEAFKMWMASSGNETGLDFLLTRAVSTDRTEYVRLNWRMHILR